MNHDSHPDQLMARALGVCWHSTTADRWPCTAEAEVAHDAEGWQQCVDWHAGYAAGRARASTPRVVVSGRSNGTIWRYADREWTDIGTVRRVVGPNRWHAFASPEVYERSSNRAAAIRNLLHRLGMDRDEYQP